MVAHAGAVQRAVVLIAHVVAREALLLADFLDQIANRFRAVAAAPMLAADVGADAAAEQGPSHGADPLVRLLVAHRVAKGGADDGTQDRRGSGVAAVPLRHPLLAALLDRLDAPHRVVHRLHAHHLGPLIVRARRRPSWQQRQQGDQPAEAQASAQKQARRRAVRFLVRHSAVCKAHCGHDPRSVQEWTSARLARLA